MPHTAGTRIRLERARRQLAAPTPALRTTSPPARWNTSCPPPSPPLPPLYAIYPSRTHLPAKVRTFLDFLVEEGR